MAATVPKSKSSKVLRCTNPHCRHDYQDKKYGVGMRVMNNTRKENGDGYRCTVCSTIVKFGGGEEKKKEATPIVAATKDSKPKGKK